MARYCATHLVPKRVPPIRANSSQGSVLRVEGDIVDCVDVLVAVRDAVRAVALEREVVLGILCVYVLDGHATLDAPEGKTCVIIRSLTRARHNKYRVALVVWDFTYVMSILIIELLFGCYGCRQNIQTQVNKT